MLRKEADKGSLPGGGVGSRWVCFFKMETETPYFYADGSDPGEEEVLMEQIRDVLD